MSQRVSVYLRFSDIKQIGNTSFEVQEGVCEALCDREGYKIVDRVRNEAVSANKTNTQRVIELLDYCKNNRGKLDILLVYKLDRFARSQEQHHWLRSELLKLGIVLRSATEKIDESPSGKLVEGVLAAVNEYDNEVKKERSRSGMGVRVDQGLWPWQPPTGYMRYPHVGDELLPHVIDDSCVSYVRQIIEKFASNLYSHTQLSKEYSAKQIKNHKGEIIGFGPQLIKKIVSNVYYAGYLPNNEGKMLRGNHEAIVALSLIQKCIQIQKERSNNNTKKRLRLNPDFPLRPFVLCVCKVSMTGCWSEGGSGKEYAHYYCRNKDCQYYSKTIGLSLLHSKFIDYLRLIKPKEEYINNFKDVLLHKFRAREGDIKKENLILLEDISRLEKEEQRIVELAKKGILPDHILRKEMEQVENNLALARTRLQESPLQKISFESLWEYAKGFIRTLDTIWEGAAPEIKTRIQSFIFPEGVVYHSECLSHSSICRLFKVIEDFGSNKDSLEPPSRIKLLSAVYKTAALSLSYGGQWMCFVYFNARSKPYQA